MDEVGNGNLSSTRAEINFHEANPTDGLVPTEEMLTRIDSIIDFIGSVSTVVLAGVLPPRLRSAPALVHFLCGRGPSMCCLVMKVAERSCDRCSRNGVDLAGGVAVCWTDEVPEPFLIALIRRDAREACCFNLPLDG